MTNEEAIAFLKQVENILLHNNSWLESTHNPIKESFEMAIEALKEKRPHGEWKYEPTKGAFCSECGWHSIWNFNFCPNCGADMREGDAE